MEHFIDEKTVMRFYLERIEKDEVVFLKGKDSLKTDIKAALEKLCDESRMNSKIQLAVVLWKKLFEGAMSYLSPNKKGYDKIFKYFDSYVEFEELIFASDSFYRDHTLHCLWVYFLGEYLFNKPDFSELYRLEREIDDGYEVMEKLSDSLHIIEGNDAKKLKSVLNRIKESRDLSDSMRCIAALTHDLGYPLKKIEKINKSINKVLPYFAIHNFENFNFEYENIQQEFVKQFIDFISRQSIVNISPKDGLSKETMDIIISLLGAGTNTSKDFNDVISKIENDLSQEQKDSLKGCFDVDVLFHSSFSQKASYYNDFEAYQHGIMSAFLLMKNLQAFQDIDYCRPDWINPMPDARVLTMNGILSTISDHTCDSYQIRQIDENSFLTFVDELEEFSRISRASQNREYVEEFCDTALYM